MVTIFDGGTVTFRVYLPHAGCVELIGDFTGWQERPVQMQREGEGWWSAELEIDGAGDGVEHRFSYLVDGMYWMPDYAASGVEHNANGRWVSRLEIPADGVEPGTVRMGRVRSRRPTGLEPGPEAESKPVRPIFGWNESPGQDRMLTQPEV